MSEKGERIAKVLARAGVGSRRDVERMIAGGRVALHGQVLTTPATLVSSVDGIAIDGKPVQAAAVARLWLYHKPFGLVTTHSDPQGRATVFENLPGHLPRVISVGRLDQNTEGLLLLTNDGELARRLELPATGLLRSYRVRVRGEVDRTRLLALAAGVTIDGIRYGPIDAKLQAPTRAVAAGESWLLLSIREGKNREVRNVLKHLGLSVVRLMRVEFGPFELGDLPAGQVIEVPQAEVAALCDQLYADNG